jgi:hypothetical protein
LPVTRTLGPLHFEDLDPKRFEDLVRQLCYDFKTWRRLEATGRSGSDDGFDARGFEITREDTVFEDEDEALDAGHNDRLWLIQCKRERSIPPAKLSSYLNDIRVGADERLHGLLFAAACDFSKKARDIFRAQCEEQGIQEWHLWGKAELEDLLFQPRNDSLLFAYFGISLTIRRRSQKTELRARLAMKRKAHRVLEGNHHVNVLLRSPDASSYPYGDEVADFNLRPPWIVAQYDGFHHSGLLFTVRRHFAYLNDTRSSWDAAFSHNDVNVSNDPWLARNENRPLRQSIYEAWSQLPKLNQAWFELKALIPFDAILDIDDIGDDYVEGPHIYVPFNHQTGPYAGYTASVTCSDSYTGGDLYPTSRNDRRLAHFKEEWRTDLDHGPYSSPPRNETEASYLDDARSIAVNDTGVD